MLAQRAQMEFFCTDYPYVPKGVRGVQFTLLATKFSEIYKKKLLLSNRKTIPETSSIFNYLIAI